MNEVPLDAKNEISFRQLSTYSMTNRIEDKVVLIDSLSHSPFHGEKNSLIVTDFIGIFFCTEGSLEMVVDGIHHKLCKGDILFCSQSVVLYDVTIPSSCKGKIVCISWEYTQKLFLRSTCQWDNILQLRYNPLLHPSICEREIYMAYYQLLYAKLKCHCYTTDIDCIFQSFFYDFYKMASRHAMQKNKSKENQISPRQEELFKRFIMLLKDKHCSEHFCSFYADQLCVTPKHLTTVIKQVSGKSVSEWIDIYLIDQIKLQLENTSLTVSEIACKLNFSNISFFGKFVKRHTGKSPKQLRWRLQSALRI